MARGRREGLIVLVFECSALVSWAMPRKLFAVGSPGAGRALGGVIFVTLAVVVAASSAPAAGPTSDREAAGPEIGDGRGGVKLVKLGDFDNPTYVDSAPGFKRLLFVVEQTGTIRVLRGSRKLPGAFLDIGDRVKCCGEEGLLSVAFPPDYRRSRRFYVYYTNTDGDNQVDEFRRRRDSPTRASEGSRRTILRIAHPGEAVHNGGQLQFGPDGYLWISTGDGGGIGDPHDNARNLSSLLGKLLRIDPQAGGDTTYRIPPDNPYVGETGRDEIYSYGFRNPWRFSFDRQSGDLTIGDVGEGSFEELNYTRRDAAKGANFGWPQFEGDQSNDPSRPGPDPPTFPIHTYAHSGDSCAVVGGFIVRDRRLTSLYGRYLYTDFCGNGLRSFVPTLDRARDDRELGPAISKPTSFGEGRRGRIYLTDDDEGKVWRVGPR